MPKTEIHFFCQNCGYESTKWLGKCPACNEWNTFVEEQVQQEVKTKSIPFSVSQEKPQPITKLTYTSEERYETSIGELDRVLGGGVVAGSAVLVAGDPGIGKSTLMLQVAHALSKNKNKTLYVSGEESAKQLRMRAERLKALSPELIVLSETNLFAIETAIKNVGPSFVIIDSIQTIYREDIPSAPGSVSQVRECAAYLTRLAKSSNLSIFFIGHVTKEGAIAGPKVLEHIVDTVLYFEGESHKAYRILRAIKNRFGSVSEVGVFEMKETGLAEVLNPSEVFLAERALSVPGSVITSTLEGTRPLLVELQALVSPTSMPNPRRVAMGVDYNRLVIITAVLERRTGLKLGTSDIYINIAGGVRIEEPAVDLPMALAIASCYKNKPVKEQTIVIGEVGLAGEVRAVNQVESRIKEAAKLGFKKAIIPAGNLAKGLKVKGIEIVGVSNVGESLSLAILANPR